MRETYKRWASEAPETAQMANFVNKRRLVETINNNSPKNVYYIARTETIPRRRNKTIWFKTNCSRAAVNVRV